MEPLFPEPIQRLPKADIPIDGVQAFLSQADRHQIIFMQFAHDVDLPEHAHNAQVGFVLAGRIELVINGKSNAYGKGDVYHIPKDAPHSGKIFAGYSDITFFDEPDRYGIK